MGGMGIGWILWITILVAVIVFSVRSLSSRPPSAGSWTDSDSPKDILRRRYARGELSEEEFHRMEEELNR